ncbi:MULTISPECIES: alpha-mannosidase [unclassified Oceanispirochaeta]|uniref:alpha-mannosidase n=1 Tax=unclassified Oceanispirochaeta TaxID=2635722 RepID=UPI000E093306|nr:MULTISPECIES: alpha-mannosidase [unclassified Oceanispirochaeta]MBF9013985.1 alpha-mannosidase [Oceanispirochaeta sp. M2]NPD70476.1 alpha-mannosidase [Oceanispirochaeta sp. M1]RDG34246.1 alpha-mannosidase [Oceanispirochaeta sp. M1]
MYFEVERLERQLKELSSLIYRDKLEISVCTIKKGDYQSFEEADANTDPWTDFHCGTMKWGDPDSRYWFRIEISIPDNFVDREIVFHLNTGKEGTSEWDLSKNPQCLVRINGEIVQGFDLNHYRILLTPKAELGAEYTIDVQAYSGFKKHHVDFIPAFSLYDRKTEQLYFDLSVPLEVARRLDENDKRRIDLLCNLNEAADSIDFRMPYSETYYTSLSKAIQYLDQVLYSDKNRKEDITATCIGHTHIDVAWLWDLKQTREKVVRSFSTVFKLMEEYPEYIFMSSQPQLYQFIKEDQPKLFQKIKEKVAQGRFEPEGAMWVEADCNLSSGESLIRQILFGTRFFREEFGVENTILWLPDVFGYCASLPQILSKFNIEYFMTSKINWNEYNKMPFDTFRWEGIDGSDVLTHFVTTTDYKKENGINTFTTYNGMIDANHIMGAWQRYQQKDINDDILVCYGYGDGGGGPTREMLETARRMERGIPGCPTVKLDKAGNYFKRLENKVQGNKRLPRWVGELYLEYHRGTYTSMGINKKYNRQSEFLYQDAEFFSVFARESQVQPDYPAEEINAGWRIILLNQFHDILPGTSIKKVYEDSWAQYEEILQKGNGIVTGAIKSLASRIDSDKESLVVFNQLGFSRTDILVFNSHKKVSTLEDGEGLHVPVQEIGSGTYFAHLQNIPSKGYKTYVIHEADICEPEDPFSFSNGRLETPFYSVIINEEGNISSLYDKEEKRQLVKKGQCLNQLQAFEDKPHNYDAWDINIYYQDKMYDVNQLKSLEVLDAGLLRFCLKIEKDFVNSKIIQKIYFYKDSRRIDFASTIDWKESQILLKAAFPLDIHSSRATYEIQYGNVERSTHSNTSWDFAQFEVCGHKWADISEDNYGVSLLNDCKYGYDIKGSTMRLSLIKSAIEPNPEADKGVHEFTYSLYPHKGRWQDGHTVRQAYFLNCPLYTEEIGLQKGPLHREMSFVSVNQENIIIEVIKKAEDRDETILRIYECCNRRTEAEFHFAGKIETLHECDLHEHKLQPLSFKGNKTKLLFKPYEIKTVTLGLVEELCD